MITITGTGLSIEDVVAIARGGESIAPLPPEARARMDRSLDWIATAVAEGERKIYGVNTGFGALSDTSIPAAEAGRLSRNLILKCCAGSGPPLAEPLVRAMMAIRASTLARGLSGVRPELAESLIRMLNRGVTPFVPGKGSLGASGDLAPLAHIAVVLTREPDGSDREDHSGRAWFEGRLLSGAEAMEAAGIPRLAPGPKEGLALTNGTTFMLAAAALAVDEAERLLDHADIAAALSLEALLALSSAFHPLLHEANGQKAQADAATRIRTLTYGSRLIDSDPSRVQDAYSLRCVPQVHAPARDAVAFIRSRVESLLTGTSDNPLVFPEADGGGRVISGGNFHGQGLAFWHDLMGIVISEVASLSERRCFRLLTPELNSGLPAMLVANPGLDSGLMLGQYTAAALVSENKTLAHPDSVDSIPSSANQEDHVSMGANAARHALEILDNVRTVLAVELVTAAQAVELRERGPDRLGRGTAAAFRQIRSRVRFLEHDRPLTPDIEAVADLIGSDTILAEVRQALGEEQRRS
ncbi:MAG: histidine ammonia-lyase [marine benthic group bacterium]|nr:histidine ammonia-lyase [Gemmatimonadota bacterium]